VACDWTLEIVRRLQDRIHRLRGATLVTISIFNAAESLDGGIDQR